MKIIYTSDTHIGLTKPKSIRKMFKQIAKEDFDLFLHLGDYCGGTSGCKSVKTTVEMFREIMPDKPYVSVLGNHDYWNKGKKNSKPSMEKHEESKSSISNTFYMNNVHFLDNDGPYIHPKFPHIKIVGHTGWYAHPNPPTNDDLYLPVTLSHREIASTAYFELDKNFIKLDTLYETSDTIIFCSHFPVIKVKGDTLFHFYSGSESFGEHIQRAYNCKHFINGHAHQSHDGPLRYESGSDYYKPAYKILEIK